MIPTPKEGEKIRAEVLLAELAGLYEISSARAPDSEEDLAHMLIEMASRLLGVSRLALVIGTPPSRRVVASWGFRTPGDLDRLLPQESPSRFCLTFMAGKESALLFLEYPRPLNERQRSLFTLFGRRAQDLYLTFLTRNARARAEQEVHRVLNESERARQALLGTMEDQKRTTEALQQSEETYRDLVENLNDVIFKIDIEGILTYASPPVRQLTGYTPEEVVGRSFREIVHPADLPVLEERFRNTLQGRLGPWEFRYFTKDGQTRWVRSSSRPFLVAGQPFGIQGTLSDITERKRAEEEREQLRIQLLQSQKLESLGTLAGGVAHEINNPIMGIMGYAQLIADMAGTDKVVLQYANEISHETERVATIVKNLLAFARNEKQTASSARLCDVVDGTLSLIRTVMRHDQVTLQVDVPDNLPEIYCRSQQIRQVIMNLLTNARDALNQKYPSADANKTILIRAEKIDRETGDAGNRPQGGRPDASALPAATELRGPRSFLRLTVEDHGPGIPQELRTRIFDPFFSTKPRGQGTGLGLSISHSIAKDHGGNLSVESEVGQWTRFHLDLPIGDT